VTEKVLKRHEKCHSFIVYYCLKSGEKKGFKDKKNSFWEISKEGETYTID